MSKYQYDNTYSYAKNDFTFKELEETTSKKSKNKKKKAISFQETNEVKNEHIFQQVVNEMYALFENEECFNLRKTEQIIIKNILIKYNQRQTSKLTGLSVRTIRNKIKEYGLKNL